MAKNSNKTPSKQGQAKRGSAKSSTRARSNRSGDKATSRMTVRRTTAPYARKAGDDDDDKPKPSRNERPDKDDKDDKNDRDDKSGKTAVGRWDDKGAADTAAADKAAAEKAAAERAAAERAVAQRAAADKAAAEKAAADKTAADQAAAEKAAVATTPPPIEEAEFAQLLPPTEIDTSWDAGAAAPPPGKAPPGDSRSFRRDQGGGEEFVLLYRFKSFLITRAGKVGKLGEWRVVEYPNMGSAAHAYAHECSELTAQGYRDFYG